MSASCTAGTSSMAIDTPLPERWNGRVPRQPMSDVIVLLPGIIGSVLQRDGKDVWAPRRRRGRRGARERSAAASRPRSSSDDPCDVDDLGDGVTAPRLIRDVHLFPGLWNIDGYAKVAQHDQRRRFDVSAGRDLLRVPVRLAARQPRRRAPAAAPGRGMAAALARSEQPATPS